MNQVKPRTIYINMHILAGDSVDAYWSQKDQRMVVKVLRDGKVISAEKVILQSTYDRKKGPKVIYKQEFNRSSHFTLDNLLTLKDYEQAWGVDTNHKPIFDQGANVCVATVCDTKGSGEHYPVLGIIFGEVIGNPENYAWRKFIEFIIDSENYDANKKYALIVDSEMDALESYNKGEKPIHQNFYLPNNWNLIYASSDTGKENLINRIISCSDKAATKIMELIATKESNKKYWSKVNDENLHRPYFLPINKPAKDEK